MSLNFRAILVAVFSLVIVGCSDSIRSPDLPPSQLIAVSALSCAPTTLGLGQSGQCDLSADCQFAQPRADGNIELVNRACPDDIRFFSSRPDVVTINDEGMYTGVGQGTSNITAQTGGVTSPPQLITVGPACVTGLELRPQDRRLVAGFDQQLQAVLIRSDSGETDVTASAFFDTDADPSVASLNGSVLQTNRDLMTTTAVDVDVTFDTATNLCANVSNPLTDSSTFTVEPAILLADGVCIDTQPPAAPFDDGVCREDTGACPTSAINLELNPPETALLQVRARFNNGLECDITDQAALAIDPTDIAVLDTDAPSITAAVQGQATLSAEFDGQTEERDVRVGEGAALGANSLAVSFRETIDGAPYSFNNAQRFACVGANDLVEGLSAGDLAGQLLAFAKARRCDVADRITLPDGTQVCTEQVDGMPSIDAFNDRQRLVDFTNIDGDPTTWTAVEGFWNGEECDAGSGNSPANVGDTFIDEDPRVFDPDRMNQPNGVVSADEAVRLGFSCVTATVDDPVNPGTVVTDGATVLVLPITNDALTQESDADADRLCNTLLPLFSNPFLSVLRDTPLDPLAQIELIETLSTVTELVNPLLEELDAVPLSFIVTTLIEGNEEFGIPGLNALTSQLLIPLRDGVVDPEVTPGLCTLTSAVNTLLTVITTAGEEFGGNQECPGGGSFDPADALGLLGSAGLLDLLDPTALADQLGALDPAALEDLVDLIGLGPLEDLLGTEALEDLLGGAGLTDLLGLLGG